METTIDLNEALAGLLDKYSVTPTTRWRLADDAGCHGEDDCLTLVPGERCSETETPASLVPLHPWRQQRRFRELKRLVEGKVISPLLMCRFACFTDGQRLPLRAILYREFDLVEWLSGTRIVAINATIAEGRAANVILRLAGGALAGVEASALLPPGTAIQDRHELIARRGVASDRAVDTQVAQSSVHIWNTDGHARHTDVDAELFGLDIEQVALVRSSFEVLRRPSCVSMCRQRHRHLSQLVELAYASDRRRERLAVKGGTS